MNRRIVTPNEEHQRSSVNNEYTAEGARTAAGESPKSHTDKVVWACNISGACVYALIGGGRVSPESYCTETRGPNAMSYERKVDRQRYSNRYDRGPCRHRFAQRRDPLAPQDSEETQMIRGSVNANPSALSWLFRCHSSNENALRHR